jgi:hypothetical protein
MGSVPSGHPNLYCVAWIFLEEFRYDSVIITAQDWTEGRVTYFKGHVWLYSEYVNRLDTLCQKTGLQRN